MTNGPWIWWWHAQRIHRLRSKFHPFHRNQDLFCSNLLHLLHKLQPTAGMWHSQPPDIMLQSPITEEDAEPYWYARVLGVYYANIWSRNPAIHGGRNARHMDFLWVCWFGEEPDYCSGFCQACLLKISFVESTYDFAFSFIDPANVVHRCHLIPAFSAGQNTGLLPHSHSTAQCANPEDVDDWLNFYVNMWVAITQLWFDLLLMHMAVSFVDLDMIMHYFGGRVGHLKNTPPQQVHRLGPADPDSEEMEVEGEEGNTGGNIREDPQDIIMNSWKWAKMMKRRGRMMRLMMMTMMMMKVMMKMRRVRMRNLLLDCIRKN